MLCLSYSQEQLWGCGAMVSGFLFGVVYAFKQALGSRGPFGGVMPWGPQKTALRRVLSLLSCEWVRVAAQVLSYWFFPSCTFFASPLHPP